MTNKSVKGGDVQSVYMLGRCAEYLECGSLLAHLEELLGDNVLILAVERAVERIDDWDTKNFESIFQFRLFRILLYAIAREFQPATVVETGVLHGMTSLFMLRAIQKNGRGGLVSVDLPSYKETGPANRDGYYATLPAGKEPGWMVPPNMRRQWELNLGSSAEVLPAISERLQEMDLFLHDSEHTYDTMSFELLFAWERLRAGGILVCDNIDSCSAFDDFCMHVDKRPLRLPAPDVVAGEQLRFGLIRRSM